MLTHFTTFSRFYFTFLSFSLFIFFKSKWIWFEKYKWRMNRHGTLGKHVACCLSIYNLVYKLSSLCIYGSSDLWVKSSFFLTFCEYFFIECFNIVLELNSVCPSRNCNWFLQMIARNKDVKELSFLIFLLEQERKWN